MSDNINLINQKLTNSEFTTFIPILIPEFLSVWETERLIQTLFKFNIDCKTIIINQVIKEDDNKICIFLQKRKQMQQKYIKTVYDLYKDEEDDLLEFDIIELPLLENEIREPKNIYKFADTYLKLQINLKDGENDEDNNKVL